MIFRRAYDHATKSWGIEVREPVGDDRRPVVLAAFSDIHANSTLGLCHPGGVELDDGGRYAPSTVQLWLWEQWAEFWAEVARRVTALGADLVVVANGDLVEGDHHQTRQLVSRNLETQHRIAMRALDPMLSLRPREIYVVRGTETHVGHQAEREEAIAREIGAQREAGTNRHSWWLLRMDLLDSLIQAQHHAPIGRLPWTGGNMANRTAMELVLSHALSGERWPDVLLAAHNHVAVRNAPDAPVQVIQLPCFQLSTSHAHKVAAGKLPSIGGAILTVWPGRQQPDCEIIRYQPARAPIVVSAAGGPACT